MDSTTYIYSNSTIHPSTNLSYTVGFVACLISAIGFAVTYLPVKKYETGDGIFFQWIMANMIYIGSFIVAAYLKFPKFQPLVMIGGVLFSTGNICVVPIVKTIGLGMGLLIWNSTAIIVGWASGRFGWFGIDPQLPKTYSLNYIGFSLSAISPFLYALVQTNIRPDTIDEGSQLEIIGEDETSINENFPIKKNPLSLLKSCNKMIGLFLSVFSGIVYGLSLVPVTYVKNRCSGSSQSDIDHIFAQSSGIYISSTLYFLIYCIIKRNKPELYPRVILPGCLCGILWLVGYIASFIAIQYITPAITQPIVSPLSGVVSTLITLIIFREVKGIRNYIIVFVAIANGSAGAILIGISKIL